jgi:hypothetical protein
MHEFLAGTTFRYFIFPIAGAMLGIAVKYVTRNDQFAKFRKEDLAVGLELLLTAALMFVALTSDRAVSLLRTNEELASVLAVVPVDRPRATRLQAIVHTSSSHVATAGWAIAMMFVALWSVSTVVRKWGWKSETEMNTVIGIAVPLAIGVLALATVMAGASK